MTTNPERDGTRPNPHAGSPHTPAGMPPGFFNRDLPLDRELPDHQGPRAIPEPPASPMRLDRMERVSFPPLPRAPSAPQGPRQAEPHGAGMAFPSYAAGPRAVPEPPPRRTRQTELEPEPDDGDLFPSGRHGHGRTQAALPYYGIPEPDAGTRSVPSFFEAVVTASRAPQPPELEPPRKRARIQWGTVFVIPLLLTALVVLYRVQPQPWQQAMLQPAPEAPPAATPASPAIPEATEADYAAREQAGREQARREQAAREQAAREQAAREQAPEAPAQPAAAAAAEAAPPDPAPAPGPAPAPAVAAAPAPAAPVAVPATPTLATPAPAVAAAPPAAPAEQYGPPLPRYASVVIRARANSPTERSEMGRIATFLQPYAGRIELLTVQNTFRSSTVRYFYPEDAAAAEQLADELSRIGEPWRVMSALPQRPVPLGRLEVWVVDN